MINSKLTELKDNNRSNLNELMVFFLRDVITGKHRSADVTRVQKADSKVFQSVLSSIGENILPRADKDHLLQLIDIIRSTREVNEDRMVTVHFLIKILDLHEDQHQKESDIMELVSICTAIFGISTNFNPFVPFSGLEGLRKR